METKMKYVKPECDRFEMETECFIAATPGNLPVDDEPWDGSGDVPGKESSPSSSVWEE